MLASVPMRFNFFEASPFGFRHEEPHKHPSADTDGAVEAGLMILRENGS
jgi:hypothetical protein